MRSRLRWMVPGVVLVSGAAACIDAPSYGAGPVAGGDARRGEQLITMYGCGSCHSVPGVAGARGRVGPPLDAFAERSFIAGTMRNEPETLVRWIRNPQALEPRTAMPTLGVTEQHARDIASFLYTLGSGGLGPPHLIPQRVLPAH